MFSQELNEEICVITQKLISLLKFWFCAGDQYKCRRFLTTSDQEGKKLFQMLFIRVILQNLVFHDNKQGNLHNRPENN
jgi:hypothetical protein